MEGFTKTITDLIRERYSCRSYTAAPLSEDTQNHLKDLLGRSTAGPLGSQMRFELVGASQDDWSALKGLGTYGFIKGAGGYIICAVNRSKHNMEDFGYVLEKIVLIATDKGLGTCWLGGSFSKSSFAKKISPCADELIPAVIAIGYGANKRRLIDALIRRHAGSDHRLPWRELFFDGTFNNPLEQANIGVFVMCLEAVRLAPSASNKQPWRIVKDGPMWHFYLNRTKGYGNRNQSIGLADLQRVDMGIAMCHFDLTANELGLRGQWVILESPIEMPGPFIDYVVTWELQV